VRRVTCDVRSRTVDAESATHHTADGETRTPAGYRGCTSGRGINNVHSDRDGNNYTGVMVGKNPFNGDSGRTSVATQIVPIIFKTHTVGTSVDANAIIATTPGDNTFNPTQPDPACLGSRNNNPLRLFQQSPIFQSADFNYGGTDVGRTQTTDAFQRANFWKVINREDYHVTLGPVSTFNAITVDVPAASGLALATTSLGPPAFCAPWMLTCSTCSSTPISSPRWPRTV
jgi:hypothetical protein